MRLRLAVALTALLAGGCGRSAAPAGANAPAGGGGGNENPYARLAVADSQRRLYDETVTGRFVGLADFEAAKGEEALRGWSVAPEGQGGGLQRALGRTRTGRGALAVSLPAGGTLGFHPPHLRDFRGYTLLQAAVYVEAIRDDLAVTLVDERGGRYGCRPGLLRPGWNTVMLDLVRAAEGVDLANVTAIELVFASADERVAFSLDDLLLVDNRRTIAPGPAGVVLSKEGLDYTLRLPGRERPIPIARSADGLWRLGEEQTAIRLAPPGGERPADDLAVMGERRLGEVELLEANPIRLRLANTWYFPPRGGEWIDPDVPRIRWEHTFYADGRWVTAVTVNGAGVAPIDTVVLEAPRAAAWSDGTLGRTNGGSVTEAGAGAWACLAAGADRAGDALRAGFAQPAAVVARLGAPDAWAAGDVGRDGFDESTGCYFARAIRGNCRIELIPRVPIVRPVFHVEGPFEGPVAVNCAGAAVREVVRLSGGVLVVVEDTLIRPTVIEFTAR